MIDVHHIFISLIILVIVIVVVFQIEAMRMVLCEMRHGAHVAVGVQIRLGV